MTPRRTRTCRPANDPPFTKSGHWVGHSDVKMTEHYQAGHGDDAVAYMKVSAELKV